MAVIVLNNAKSIDCSIKNNNRLKYSVLKQWTTIMWDHQVLKRMDANKTPLLAAQRWGKTEELDNYLGMVQLHLLLKFLTPSLLTKGCRHY